MSRLSYLAERLAAFLAERRDPFLHHEWLAKRSGLIIADALLPAGYHALEIGCGTGCNFHLLTRAARIHAIDIIPDFVDIVNGPDIRALMPPGLEVEAEIADASTFQSRGPYDLILSVYVLWDRVPMSDADVQRLLDQLKPGGYLYLYTLARERILHFPNAVHPRGRLALWRERARTLGLRLAGRLGWRPSPEARLRHARRTLAGAGLRLVNDAAIRYAKGVSAAMLWWKPPQEARPPPATGSGS